MRFASSRQLFAVGSPRARASPPFQRPAAAVSASTVAFEAVGACMLIATFLAMAMFG